MHNPASAQPASATPPVAMADHLRLFDAFRDAVFCADRAGLITYLNPAAAALFGYSSTALPGLVVRDLIATGDLDAFNELLAGCARGGADDSSTKTVSMMGKKKDGAGFPAEISLTPLGAADERSITIFVRDMTERRRLSVLARNEKTYRALVENLPTAMILMSLDTEIIFCNQHAAELLDFENYGRTSGNKLLDLIVADDRERADADLRDIPNGETAEFTYGFACNDDATLTIELRVSLVVGDNGNPKGLLAIARETADDMVETGIDGEQIKNVLMDTFGAVSSIIKLQDPYIADHQERVTKLACAIAKHLKLPEESIDCLRVAGNFHDVGKLRVPTQILSKPGKLTEEEFSIVKNHPRTSHEVIDSIEFPWPVAKTIFQHHERLDGSGYPDGAKGREIIIEARILAVADVMEAMSSRRPYRAGLGVEKALDELRAKSDILFDAEICECCAKLFLERKFHFV